MSQSITIAGVPLPSSAPWFLAIIAVHVAAGVVCVVAGIVAMLSAKKPGRHPRAGTVYLRALLVVFATMMVVVVVRWPADNALGLLGTFALGAAFVGRRARRRARPGWECVHVPGMGLSYVALLTAFYVDNGPHLPLWNRLPSYAFWVLPSLVGMPIIAVAWSKRCPPAAHGLYGQGARNPPPGLRPPQ